MRALWQSLHANLVQCLEPLTVKMQFDTLRQAQPELRGFVVGTNGNLEKPANSF